MGQSGLTGLPAVALARMVRERAVSAVEVSSAHLDRVEAVNGAINGVVVLDAEGALARARRSDAALAREQALGGWSAPPL